MGWVSSTSAPAAQPVKSVDAEMDLGEDPTNDTKQEGSQGQSQDAAPKDEKEEKVEVDYDVAEEDAW